MNAIPRMTGRKEKRLPIHCSKACFGSDCWASIRISFTIHPCCIILTLEVGNNVLGGWYQPLFGSYYSKEQRWFCKCLSKSFWEGIQLRVIVHFAQVIIFNYYVLPVRKLKCRTIILTRTLYKAVCACQSHQSLIVILTIALLSKTNQQLFRKHHSPRPPNTVPRHIYISFDKLPMRREQFVMMINYCQFTISASIRWTN